MFLLAGRADVELEEGQQIRAPAHGGAAGLAQRGAHHPHAEAHAAPAARG